MKKLKIALVVALTSVATGCSTFSEVPNGVNLSQGELAVLTDYTLDKGFIKIRTPGNGCTFFNSFKVEVGDKDDNSIKIIRTRPDQCRMRSRNVSLQYSFKHLGLDLNKAIRVDNPVERTDTPRLSAN